MLPAPLRGSNNSLQRQYQLGINGTATPALHQRKSCSREHPRSQCLLQNGPFGTAGPSAGGRNDSTSQLQSAADLGKKAWMPGKTSAEGDAAVSCSLHDLFTGQVTTYCSSAGCCRVVAQSTVLNVVQHLGAAPSRLVFPCFNDDASLVPFVGAQVG